MRAFGVIVVGFAAFAMSFVLLDEASFAQDTKDEKKTEEKKTDDEKKVDKKVVVRLADPSDVNRAKKKIGKVKDVKTEDPAEVTVVLADPSKEPEFREWVTKHQKEMQGIKDPKQRIDKMKAFPALKAAEYITKIYTGDELQVSVTETVRIRTLILPKVYDDNNKEKKLSSVELSKLKAPPLPGYTSALANLKAGQIVEIYIKPPPPAPKSAPSTTPVVKKGPIGADPKDTGPPMATKSEAYMILIQQEP
jgi:hypothetical protein